MKRGLVLEGGAMRGLFTAGVLDVLMEHGVTFDGAVGVSAGAAALIAPKEPLDISRVCHDPARMQRVYDIGRAAGEEYLSRAV